VALRPLGIPEVCNAWVGQAPRERSFFTPDLGTFFACEQAGIWPEFVCLSKGISGGTLPLSLVMTWDEIYEVFSMTMSRGASCTRTPTPATRWPAERRWRCSTASMRTTSLPRGTSVS